MDICQQHKTIVSGSIRTLDNTYPSKQAKKKKTRNIRKECAMQFTFVKCQLNAVMAAQKWWTEDGINGQESKPM